MRFLSIIFLFCMSCGMNAQSFVFPAHKKKVSIPFKLVNNLVVFPLKVNGIELSFILDTGVEQTILFSLDDKDKAVLYNVEKVKLRGFGSEEPVDALKSTHNTISVKNLQSGEQDIYVIMDRYFDFSESLGVPVNGLAGYHFFKGNVVEVNYSSKKIIVYDSSKYKPGRLTKGFTPYPISIEKAKPYITGLVSAGKEARTSKLLIDSGNSDALWLFLNKDKTLEVREPSFVDFLGLGFSGEVYGKKARIPGFSLLDFSFKNPIVAFPDTLAMAQLKMVQGRVGSVGGEILKRFNIIFDYEHEMVFLKKSNNFNAPFVYNMSGIVMHHSGVRWVQEEDRNDLGTSSTIKIKLSGDTPKEVKYKFELKPVYEIVAVRPGSPGEKCGLKKGDILVTLNGNDGYTYALQEINALLRSEEGREIKMTIERGTQVMKFAFRLESIL